MLCHLFTAERIFIVSLHSESLESYIHSFINVKLTNTE